MEEPERQIAHTKNQITLQYGNVLKEKSNCWGASCLRKMVVPDEKKAAEQNGEQTVGSEAWNNYALKTPG